jgi:hypothetical protein
MICHGYRFDHEGKYGPSVLLADQDSVIRFIQDNLEAPQLLITDAGDNQLLLMRDGVDIFNVLDQYGISLAAIFEELRQDIASEGTSPKEKPEWEVLYDQIGLSPGEIHMRQRVKAACRAAKTVADVAELVRGTYFDAHFVSEDGQKWCRFFNEDDHSAKLMIKDESSEWVDDPDLFYLSPRAKVKHLRSSEDIHTFLLIDL